MNTPTTTSPASEITEFKEGDIVVFADKANDAWQGGKGVIRGQDDAGYYDIEVLEVPPNNTSAIVGQEICDKAKNLKLYGGTDPGEAVEHPAHYGGADNPYEVIKVAEAWGLDKDAYLFNVLKYIARAGKKSADTELQDNEKAYFYLGRKIERLKELVQ